jgi:hypothetical protein
MDAARRMHGPRPPLPLLTARASRCARPLPMQFPDGLMPTGDFELRGRPWRVLSRKTLDGRRTVHLAVPADAAADADAAAGGAPAPRTPGRLAAHPLRDADLAFDQAERDHRAAVAGAATRGKRTAGDAAALVPAEPARAVAAAPARRGAELYDSPMERRGAGGRAAAKALPAPHGGGGGGSSSGDDDTSTEDITPRLLMTRVGPGALRGRSSGSSSARSSFSGDSVASSSASSAHAPLGLPRPAGAPRAEAAAAAAARRKYVRDVVVATNPAADNLVRYKALIALIEHCKARARRLAPGGHTDWAREPAASLLHAIVDVGEALAGFGNAQFPERSGEARAVLAADYKALLSEYLTHLGGVLVPGACRGLAPETEAELRSVGSLLSTRCGAYKVLYEQLVRHVGAEGGGSGGDRGGGGAPCLIFNTNSNVLTASPVTNNNNSTEADAKAEALNKGIGAAALAAAAVGAALLLRALFGRGGGGGPALGGRRLPRGRNAREMALVSALSACGDELRKAERNDSALHNDWRLGRHIRFAWPPAPEPPGYAPLSAEVCNITGVLQNIYG